MAARLDVQHIAQRMQEQLFPLLDRANRLMIRNMQALKEVRQTPAPSVQIGSAGQVNVATAQANVAEPLRTER